MYKILLIPQILKCSSCFTLLAAGEMLSHQLEDLRYEWQTGHRSDSQPVLGKAGIFLVDLQVDIQYSVNCAQIGFSFYPDLPSIIPTHSLVHSLSLSQCNSLLSLIIPAVFPIQSFHFLPMCI